MDFYLLRERKSEENHEHEISWRNWIDSQKVRGTAIGQFLTRIQSIQIVLNSSYTYSQGICIFPSPACVCVRSIRFVMMNVRQTNQPSNRQNTQTHSSAVMRKLFISTISILEHTRFFCRTEVERTERKLNRFDSMWQNYFACLLPPDGLSISFLASQIHNLLIFQMRCQQIIHVLRFTFYFSDFFFLLYIVACCFQWWFAFQMHKTAVTLALAETRSDSFLLG